jgi:hypothetical protein
MTVDGRDALSIEFTVPAPASDCPGSYEIWPGSAFYAGEHHELLIVDVDGTYLIIDAEDGAATEAERADIRSILDSIRLERAESPAPSAGPGEVTLEVADVRATLTLPVGWHVDPDRPGVAKGDQSYLVPSVELSAIDHIWRYPCTMPVFRTPTPASPIDRLAELIASAEGSDASSPTPAVVDDRDAVSMELSIPDPRGACRDSVTIWGSEDLRGGGKALYSGEHHALLIVDVDGTKVIVDAQDVPATDGELEEIRSIVDSIRLERVTPEALTSR